MGSEGARVVVTGGCGFVGSNLVRHLRAHTPWEIVVVDDLRTGNRAHVEGRAKVVVGDAGDGGILESVLDGADAVVHLASQTGVGPSVEDPVRDFAGNASTTFRLLEGCRRARIARVVFASSGAALGDAPPPLHEELVPRPLSPYGAGKLAGEAYCQAYAGSFGMATVALRFSNVYGPYSAHKRNAVPNFIKRCLRDEPIEIYGDGMQTRDFIHVDDLCAGIVAALTADDIAGEVFQLATGAETSIVELAETVRTVTGASSQITFHPGRPGEVYKSRADISKARRLLAFDPRITLREGLAGTAQWYRENPSAVTT